MIMQQNALVMKNYKAISKIRRSLENKKIITSHRLIKKIVSKQQIKIDWKPTGLWYSIGTSWLDWCFAEQPDWIGKYIYKIEVNPKKILLINTVKKLDDFSKHYKIVPEWMKTLKFKYNYINWRRFSASYSGIEISPYQWKRRFDLLWYYGWDCSSGCIWNPNAIISLRLLYIYNSKSNEFRHVKHPIEIMD